jgi:uncharacterized protein (DUF433 family)
MAYGTMRSRVEEAIEDSTAIRGDIRAMSDDVVWGGPAPARTVLPRRFASEYHSDPEANMTFSRITVRPDQMGGVPCIRGFRIPVATVVGMVADGMTETEILKDFPDLEQEDIREALRYAAEAVRERELPLIVGE